MFKKIISWLILVSLLLGFFIPFNVSADNNSPNSYVGEFSSNEILVKYKNDNQSTETLNRVKSKRKNTRLESKRNFKVRNKKIELLEFEETDDIEQVLADLNNDPNVEIAEPNYTIYSSAATNANTLKWGLKNTGQNFLGQTGTNGYDVNILSTIGTTRGSSDIIVAVIDSGIDISHPELASAIFTNTAETLDGIDSDNNGFIDDVNGWNFADNNNIVFSNYMEDYHGTHVAGIIAAQDTSTTIESVAPNVKILPLKFIKGNSGTTADAVRAIIYAEQMGASIVNCSWGSYVMSSILRDVIQGSNMLFTCSAGNESNSGNRYPAGHSYFDNVISVAAMDNQGNLASFSNYGSDVTIAAPGQDIYSTMPNESNTFLNGTSMAAPFVAGAAALLKSIEPTITAREIKDRIIASATYSNKLEGYVETDGYLNVAGALGIGGSSNQIAAAPGYGSQTVNRNNILYSVGGFDGDFLDDFSRYNPANNKWYRAPSMSVPRAHAGVAEYNGDVYAIGGYDGGALDSVERYDIWEDAWIAETPLPKALYASATCSFGVNKIYVFGGMNEIGYSNDVYVFNIVYSSWQSSYWSKIATMPYSAAYLRAEVCGDRIYLMGGVNESGALDTVYEYNPVSNTWAAKSPMLSHRQNAASAVLDGKIYMFGGLNTATTDIENGAFSSGDEITSYLTSVEVYDPKTDVWGKAPDISEHKVGFSAETLFENIITSGGTLFDGTSGITEVYKGSKYPQGLKATTGSNGNITVAWSKLAEATGYELEINDAIYTINSNNTTSYSYTHIANTVDKIRVRAIIDGDKCVWSDYLYKCPYDSMIDAKPLTMDVSASDTLLPKNNSVWYKINPGAIGYMDIALSDITEASSVYYSVEMYDSAGNMLEVGYNDNGVYIINNVSVYNTNYYIRVGKEIVDAGGEQFELICDYSNPGADDVPDRVYVNKLATDNESISAMDDGEGDEPVPFELLAKQLSAELIEYTPDEGNVNSMASYTPTFNNGYYEMQNRYLSSPTSSDYYTVSLGQNEKLTAVVIPPSGQMIFQVFIYTGSNTAYTWCEAYENDQKRSICSVVKKSSGTTSYTVEVKTSNNTNITGPYTLRLYKMTSSQVGDLTYEPNFWPGEGGYPGGATQLTGVGSSTANATLTLNQKIDSTVDRDYFKLSNLNAGTKVTVKLKLEGAYATAANAAKFDFDVWNLYDSGINSTTGWTWYDYRGNSFNNGPVAQVFGDGTATKVLSFIVPDTSGTPKKSKDFYIVVRTSAGYSSNEPGDKYSITCTTVASSAFNDPRENYSGYNNDYIKIDNRDSHLPVCVLPENVSASIDNELDADWYKLVIPSGSGTQRGTFSISNNGYVDVALFNSAGTSKLASGHNFEYNYLTLGTTYYLAAYPNSNWNPATPTHHGYTLNVASNNMGTITNISYVGGAKIGKDNSVHFTFTRTETVQASYTVYIYAKWSTGIEYSYKTEDTFDMANGETVTNPAITVPGVALYSSGNGLVTQVLIKKNGDTVADDTFITNVGGLGGNVMAQEVKFETTTQIEEDGKTKNCYYIFDDHPEWIRRCDLLDDSSKALTRFENLSSGIYTVFSYHHTTMSGTPNRYSFGIPVSKSVYFDTVFSNTESKSGKVKIRKIGFGTRASDDWHGVFNIWRRFEDSNHNGTEYTVTDSSNQYRWLTDEISQSTLINSSDFGYSWLIMEFEVTDGTVDFSTVAYETKSTAKTKFGSGAEAHYETLETVKGKAAANRILRAKEMHYFIDDSIPAGTKLPFSVTSSLYDDRKVSLFTTNSTPLCWNNQYNTPESSIIGIDYYASGVTRSKSGGSITATEPYRGWTFDHLHSRFAENHSIGFPLNWLVGKSTLSSNEELTQGDIDHLATLDANGREQILNMLDAQDAEMLAAGEGITAIMPGFGITYEYTVKVTNSSSDVRDFNYLMLAPQGVYKFVWEYYNTKQGDGWGDYMHNQTSRQYVFCDHNNNPVSYGIEPGQTAIFKIWVTMMTSSSPTLHNVFIIDPSTSDLTNSIYHFYEQQEYHENY